MLQGVAYTKHFYKNVKKSVIFYKKAMFCIINLLTGRKNEYIFLTDESDC